nr:MAG TPA: hypothetical protein [Caudoviricetes sp.]
MFFVHINQSIIMINKINNLIINLITYLITGCEKARIFGAV